MAKSDSTTNDILRSVHTSNLPEIFNQLRISLVVSTYQMGKVILVRSEGETLNTHFRTFSKPMGVAADASRMTIGGANTIWHYRNVPAVAAKLEPQGKHDACYIPRSIHVTGDIDIHEMAYDTDDELWVVNTRFSCLCTIDQANSFNPRWRPYFVSAYAPEDRCHLNGLAMVDGRPKYVTALGETDSQGGWRKNKANGGLLMDVDSNDIILRGLSMPHSPRRYQDKLWVLESGQGALSLIDEQKQEWQTVAEMPGFTRGIDFYGPLAFIGISQVRESATFSGIPLVQKVRQRNCGVWVINIESGETLGFLRFEEGVQEIFAVQVLHEVRFPELLEWGDEKLSHSYVLPDEALAEVKLPSQEELEQTPGFYFQKGTELYHKGKLEESIAAYQTCYALDDAFPNIDYNLGVALGDAGRYTEAAEHLNRVIKNEPERAEAWNSLGHIANAQRQPQEATRHYEKAIELLPDYAQAHFNLGMTLLQQGDFKRGLKEHEWRWKTGEFTPFQCPHEKWNGKPVAEQTLLVHTEQGAGDAMQFARFLPLAAQRCKKLIVVSPADMMPLLSTLQGVSEVREAGTINLSEFDTWLPLMSLPYVLGITPDTIPADMPCFDVETIRRRKALELPQSLNDSRKKAGIVWAGSPTHKNDKNRSCKLEQLLPVLKTPNVQFFSLQKGMGDLDYSEQLAKLPANVQVENLAPYMHDFGATAQLIDKLDLVISVDTSIAHLAASLGKPVWLLLCYVPDWRWGLEQDTTPWYPSMRLFRQDSPNDWESVVSNIVKLLQPEY